MKLLAAAAIGGAAIGGGAIAQRGDVHLDRDHRSERRGDRAGTTEFPAHGTAAHEDLEKPVTGANAAKAQVAAVKAVGRGQGQ